MKKTNTNNAKMDFITYVYNNNNILEHKIRLAGISCKDIHSKLASYASQNKYSLRVYAKLNNGGHIDQRSIALMALQVAKVTAKNALQRQPNKKQAIIYNSLCSRNFEFATMPINYILDTKYLDHDAQEFVSIVKSSLLVNYKQPTAKAISLAYKELNNYIMASRNQLQAFSIEQMNENGTQLVKVDSNALALLKGKSVYIPMGYDTKKIDRTLQLREALILLFNNITPTQKKIILLSYKGYTQRDITKKLGYKSNATVNEHFSRLRAKAVELWQSEYNNIIYDIKAIMQVVAKRNANRHKKS